MHTTSCDKTINGLGKIEGGDFDLTLLTDEMSGYRLVFISNGEGEPEHLIDSFDFEASRE